MSNVFTQSLTHTSSVGTPSVELGTLQVFVPSIQNVNFISSPAIAHIYIGGLGISNDRQKLGIPSFYTTSQIPEIHPQIEFQLPEFVQQDHREFIEFVKAYYRFTEKADGPLHFLRRLLIVQDIDQTTNELIEYFYREYAPNFPRDTSLSPASIIKHIKEFYRAKGTEKSFKFLFKVLFAVDIEFYYPRLDILRFSDGKWMQDRTIRTVLLQGDPSDLEGNRIIGSKSKASAFVERVGIAQEGIITVHELYLNVSSIVGKFDVNEVVRNESGSTVFRIIPSVSQIEVTSPGRGYEVGQEVIVNGTGFNCKCRISAVGQAGEVQSVEIYQFGAGYQEESTTVSFPIYTGVISQAIARPIFGAVNKYPGYFLNLDGTFSALKYLQDSYYYQQFSYVIRSPESRERYANIVKNIVHPAGLIFFSEVILESEIEVRTTLPEDSDGNVCTNTEMFTDLRFDYNEFDAAIHEYIFVDAETSIADSDYEMFTETVTYDGKNVPLGPNWNDWTKWKADYRPTPVLGQPTDEILQPGYYSLYANTPLKVFADVKLADIAFKPLIQIDHLPETLVSQE
jgi:hypothetical protein